MSKVLRQQLDDQLDRIEEAQAKAPKDFEGQLCFLLEMADRIEAMVREGKWASS